MNRGIFVTGLIVLCAAFSAHKVYAQDIEQIDVKHPVKLSGNVNLQLESYSASGIANRRKPFSWLVTGNPTLTVFSVDVPFSFLFSNFENKYYQPFNQFGISPRYKWITLHLGYRNVLFNPFTLGDMRILGAGVELNPRGFRFGAMYGRVNRSTTLLDTLQNANPLAYRSQLSYTRMVYAAKIGVGGERNYFDISYLKGWDVENSLSPAYRDSFPPQEDKVLGFAWQKTMFKKIVWKTDIGLSVYTLNTTSSLVSDSFDLKQFKRTADFLQVRTSTQYLVAGETRLGWRDRNFGVDLIYRRVDPDYKSMGAYFFQSDVAQYTVAPYLKLDSGKLIINGNAGLQNDNLYKQKLATSKRFIGNLNVNYNPSQLFGVNANYSNYGITQNPTYLSTKADLFKQVSQNVTCVPYVNLIGETNARSIQLVASYQVLHSPTTSINTSPDQHTLVGTLVYSYTYTKRGLNFNGSLNYNSTNIAGQGKIGSYGVGAGCGIPVWNQKTSINVTASYNTNFYNSQFNGHAITADATCTIPVYKRHTIQLTASYLNNQSNDETFIQTFSEYIFRFGYGFAF